MYTSTLGGRPGLAPTPTSSYSFQRIGETNPTGVATTAATPGTARRIKLISPVAKLEHTMPNPAAPRYRPLFPPLAAVHMIPLSTPGGAISKIIRVLLRMIIKSSLSEASGWLVGSRTGVIPFIGTDCCATPVPASKMIAGLPLYPVPVPHLTDPVPLRVCADVFTSGKTAERMAFTPTKPTAVPLTGHVPSNLFCGQHQSTDGDNCGTSCGPNPLGLSTEASPETRLYVRRGSRRR